MQQVNALSPTIAPLAPPMDEVALRQAIGQRIIIGFEGTTIADPQVQEALQLAKMGQIGGIILFSYNVKSPTQLKALTAAFKAVQRDILIAVDQEGGRVQRLSSKNGFIDTPSPQKVATTLSPQEALATYSAMAQMLKKAGVNLNLAPSIDLNNEKTPCPVIGKLGRSYGSDINTIATYAGIFVDAHRLNGVLTALKHFPGHGFAKKDSHKGMVDITNTTSPQEQDVFYRLIHNGKADMIMTAHLMQRSWDKNWPATLSQKILNERLRTRTGYDGVIISDDLHMGAIGKNFGKDEVIFQAFAAGVDILLFSNNKLATGGHKDFKSEVKIAAHIPEIILKAIKEGRLQSRAVMEGARRVQIMKTRLIPNH